MELLNYRSYSFIAIFTCIYFIIGAMFLSIGQPAEDAYILFKYAKNLADGFGIVFNSVGPPTEGATDFLYLILITIFTTFIHDTALSALIVNTIGFALVIAGILYFLTRLDLISRNNLFFLGFLLFVLIFSQLTAASYLGFSTTSFCALALWLSIACYFRLDKLLIAIPYLGLALGLFRPDGLIIAIAAVGIALWQSDAQSRRKLLPHLIICAGAGISYFIWRYTYFGLLLPLPLYVKQVSTELLPGLSQNIYAAKRLMPLLIIIVWRSYYKQDAKMLIMAIPYLIHILFLMLAFQTQNVNFRFQAPTFILLYLWTTYYLIRDYQFIKKPAWIFSIFFLILSCLMFFYQAFTAGTNKDYMQNFPATLTDILDHGDTIALTEAGRLPYFVNTNAIDTVGLNHNYAGTHAINPQWLGTLEPDVVMAHNLTNLNLPTLSKNVLALPCNQLKQMIRTKYLKWQPDFTKERQASLSSIYFLNDNYKTYSCYLVNFQGLYKHLYGVHIDWLKSQAFMHRLEESFLGPSMSYFDAVERAHDDVF